jgi:hypothetical protein
VTRVSFKGWQKENVLRATYTKDFFGGKTPTSPYLEEKKEVEFTLFGP